MCTLIKHCKLVLLVIHQLQHRNAPTLETGSLFPPTIQRQQVQYMLAN